MASYSAFVGGETFSPGSQITFGSLDFLIEEIDELRLISHNVVNTIGLGPTRSIRTKAEKQCLRRRTTTLKQRPMNPPLPLSGGRK